MSFAELKCLGDRGKTKQNDRIRNKNIIDNTGVPQIEDGLTTCVGDCLREPKMTR